MSGMTREDAIDRLEFRVRHTCPEANGDNIGDCDLCYRNPCNDMVALKTLWDERPHGEWIPIHDRKGREIAYKCSVCEQNPKYAVRSEFCPKCGADMRRKEGDSKC